ncbi:hypothetical protein ABPG72_020533 [Tetrahymena utriculariae]
MMELSNSKADSVMNQKIEQTYRLNFRDLQLSELQTLQNWMKLLYAEDGTLSEYLWQIIFLNNLQNIYNKNAIQDVNEHIQDHLSANLKLQKKKYQKYPQHLIKEAVILANKYNNLQRAGQEIRERYAKQGLYQNIQESNIRRWHLTHQKRTNTSDQRIKCNQGRKLVSIQKKNSKVCSGLKNKDHDKKTQHPK